MMHPQMNISDIQILKQISKILPCLAEFPRNIRVHRLSFSLKGSLSSACLRVVQIMEACMILICGLASALSFILQLF